MKNNKQLKLLNFVFIIITILALILHLTGCAEVESKHVVDYRYNEPRTDVVTDYKYKYNWHEDKYELVPDTHTEYIPEKYELMWEYRYDDDHKERRWEECTRYEYENARKELEK